MDRQPDRVFAPGKWEFGADVETSFTSLLKVTDGPHVVLDGVFDRPRQSRCEIIGSTGTICMGSPFLSGVEAEVLLSNEVGRDSLRLPPQDLFQLQFEHFSACVMSGAEQAIPTAETLRTARVQAALPQVRHYFDSFRLF
jgi:predicted dehydrogenase